MWIGSMTVNDLPGIDLMLRVGFAARRASRCSERDLGTEHRGQANGARGFREAHDAVEAVMISERQRFEAETGRLFGKLLGMRRAIEE